MLLDLDQGRLWVFLIGLALFALGGLGLQGGGWVQGRFAGCATHAGSGQHRLMRSLVFVPLCFGRYGSRSRAGA